MTKKTTKKKTASKKTNQDNIDEFISLAKDLKEIVLKYKSKKVRGGDNNTSWGILVPIRALINVM